MDDATVASLAKASHTRNFLLLCQQGMGRMATSIGVGKEEAGVVREVVGAQTAQRRLQLAEEFVAASIELRVNVVVDVVGVHNRTQAVKLVDCLVNAAQEGSQLNVVDEQQRWLIGERSRVLATEIGGVLMA